MIKVSNEEISTSGPWVMEFGQYERVLSNEITNEECQILDQSSPKLEVMRCDIDNIDIDKLSKNFYVVERSNGEEETWYYTGPSRINKTIIFMRPFSK